MSQKSKATGTPLQKQKLSRQPTPRSIQKGLLRSRQGKIIAFTELDRGRDPATLVGKTIIKWCDAIYGAGEKPTGMYFAIWLKEEPENPILFKSHNPPAHGWFHNWKKAPAYLHKCREKPSEGTRILEAAAEKVVRVKRCMGNEGRLDMNTDQKMEEVWGVGLKLEGMDKMEWMWGEKMRPCDDVWTMKSEAAYQSCTHFCDLWIENGGVPGTEGKAEDVVKAEGKENSGWVKELGDEIFGKKEEENDAEMAAESSKKRKMEDIADAEISTETKKPKTEED